MPDDNLPPGASLISGQVPMQLPPGAALVSSPTEGTGEKFIKANQQGPVERQLSELALGATSAASGLPETEHPFADFLKIKPDMSIKGALSQSLGPLPSIASGLYGIGKEIFSSQQPGESPDDAAARRAHGAGRAIGTVAPVVLAEEVGKIGEAIPSAEHAGAALQDIKTTAGSVPINMTKPGNTALELYTQSQRGAQLPMAVRKLVVRATDPQAAPLTYEEAKDFQSNISNLSVNERMSLKPNTARLVGQLNQDLKASLEEAADTQGKGQKFTDAMQEYHNAMKIRGFSEKAIEYAIKSALIGAGGYGLKKLYDASGL